MRLELRYRKEGGNDDGREQLKVVRVKLQPEDDDHDRVVDNAAEYDKAELYGEVAALAEDSVAQDLTDDDRRKADYYGAAAPC